MNRFRKMIPARIGDRMLYAAIACAYGAHELGPKTLPIYAILALLYGLKAWRGH